MLVVSPLVEERFTDEKRKSKGMLKVTLIINLIQKTHEKPAEPTDEHGSQKSSRKL